MAYLHGRNQKNAVFIWIPKTAGTSVYKSLGAVRRKALPRIKYRFANNGLYTFGHMDYIQLVEQGYVSNAYHESAYKFAFVRNPYDRAVSLFFYLKKVGTISIDETFLSFCRRLNEEGYEPIGLYNVSRLSQCNPQVRWVEKIKMDFVGKLESIEKDLKTIFDDLGIEEVVLPKLNKSNRSEYSEYYCLESKEIIELLYKEDFQNFGYKMESFL